MPNDNKKIGIEFIKQFYKDAPEKSGVYKMQNSSGHVIYVGKAKNLKNRLYSYTKEQQSMAKNHFLVTQVANIEVQITKTEEEALILEAILVRKHKPKYNILLKDDKTFPYIEIGKEDFPRIRRVRVRYASNKKLYGPFASSQDVTNSVDFLQKTFKLRTCGDYFFNTRQRPCMLYQIKHCSAPCVGKISKENYQDSINQAVAFLNGKNKKLWDSLLKEMEQAAKNEDFEKAILYRDRIQALTKIQSKQYVSMQSNQNCDFVDILKQNNNVGIGVVFIRKGHNNGFLAFYPSNAENETKQNILERFVFDFYNNKEIPEKIYISDEVKEIKQLNSAFNKMYNCNTQILQATQKPYSEIMQHLQTNLENSLTIYNKKSSKWLTNFKDVQKILQLQNEITSIEVYDNSHFQGSSALGAMVYVDQNGFNKSKYKTFSIKDSKIDTKDDYAMMAHMLERRVKKAIKDNDFPSLMVIDGGKGQLGMVKAILEKYNALNMVNVIAISKGPNRNLKEETIYSFYNNPLKLKKDDANLHFLQYIRDEVHNFAITSHRKKRMKNMFKSPLDNIEGIGEKRKQILLSHFGSVKALTEARVEDIAKVKTINKSLAVKIFEYLH